MIGPSTRWLIESGTLRCPACVAAPNRPTDQDPGKLDAVGDKWLVCRDCQRKYPVPDDIPQLLTTIGDEYRATPVEELP